MLKGGASKITIDGSSITFKSTKIKGTADASVEFKGNASAKFEGGGMTEVKSGGMLTLKGALTKVN